MSILFSCIEIFFFLVTVFLYIAIISFFGKSEGMKFKPLYSCKAYPFASFIEIAALVYISVGIIDVFFAKRFFFEDSVSIGGIGHAFVSLMLVNFYKYFHERLHSQRKIDMPEWDT